MKQIAELANISKSLPFLGSLHSITIMIQGCQDVKQSTRTDISPAEDHGRHGKLTMSLFLTEPMFFGNGVQESVFFFFKISFPGDSYTHKSLFSKVFIEVYNTLLKVGGLED